MSEGLDSKARGWNDGWMMIQFYPVAKARYRATGTRTNYLYKCVSSRITDSRSKLCFLGARVAKLFDESEVSTMSPNGFVVRIPNVL